MDKLLPAVDALIKKYNNPPEKLVSTDQHMDGCPLCQAYFNYSDINRCKQCPNQAFSTGRIGCRTRANDFPELDYVVLENYPRLAIFWSDFKGRIVAGEDRFEAMLSLTRDL